MSFAWIKTPQTKVLTWDGNAIKLGCDDHCTTINVIKFIKNFKKNKSSHLAHWLKDPTLPQLWHRMQLLLRFDLWGISTCREHGQKIYIYWKTPQTKSYLKLSGNIELLKRTCKPTQVHNPLQLYRKRSYDSVFQGEIHIFEVTNIPRDRSPGCKLFCVPNSCEHLMTISQRSLHSSFQVTQVSEIVSILPLRYICCPLVEK